MISYRTILVDLSSEALVLPLLRTARALAERFDAAVIGLHVMPPPAAPAFYYGGASVSVGQDLVLAQRQANQEVCGRVRALFDELTGSDSRQDSWREEEGEVSEVLARAARTTDLVVAGKGDDAAPSLDHLLVAAGVPVLVVPARAAFGAAGTVMVGWNGSREATRALHGALPFLVAASRVILCTVGGAGAGLEDAHEMLRRHGVAAEARHVAEQELAAGAWLLAQADKERADLLVMGAYGHTRLREYVFGGVTRVVLRDAAIPVLFGS